MDDMSRRSFTLLDIGQAIDEGAKFLQGEIGPLKNRTSLSLVANQRQYTLPTNVQEPNVLEYWDSSGPREIESKTNEAFRIESGLLRSGTIPERYTFLESERVLLLDPRPDTAAGTTTINDAAGISATATSVTVASTSGFPAEGRLIIESEVISYTGTTSTTFTGLTRGLEGTTAATHADTTTVTERDLQIWGKRLYQDREMRTNYTTGTIAITNGLTALVGTGTSWAIQVAAGDYFGITSNVTTTDPIKWYKIQTVTDATNIVLADAFTEATQTTGTYIISSPNPFPNYMDSVLIAYAIQSLLKKTGPAGMAQAGREWATVERFLSTAKKNNVKHDTILRPRPQAFRRRTQRMGVVNGEYYIS